MSSKLRVVYPNAADAAALSAVPAEIAAMPVSHLQDQTRARIWRSNSVVAGQHILGDFGSYSPVSALVLWRHNLTTAATYRLRLFNDPAQSGAINYDSGTRQVGELLLPWGDFAWGVGVWGAAAVADWPAPYFSHFFTPVPALSFDLQLDDPSNPDGFLQASRLVLGESWSPTLDMSVGLTHAWRETSSQTRTDGGSLRTDARDPYRRMVFSLEALGETDRAVMSDKARRAGLRNDIFLSCFAEAGGALERDYAALCKLVEVPSMGSPFLGLHATQLTFEES